MASGKLEEYCREWPDGEDRCNKPADFILWGKLFDPQALGPRCYDHAAKWIGWQNMYPSQLEQWAIYDLRRVRETVAKLKCVCGENQVFGTCNHTDRTEEKNANDL